MDHYFRSGVQVPFFNLKDQHHVLRHVIDAHIKAGIESFQYINGKQVHEFERAFAAALNAPHLIPTGNGTDSLFISLKALDIGIGDEVITPAFSCFPSAEVISLCNATPVFADVHPEYFTLDPEQLEQRITPRTKAVIVVHLFGQSGQLREIAACCEKHNLHLIEDCAQAHLTQYQGKYAGTFGTTGAFSFYPTKNLGAYGDAGCVVTSDDALAERIRRLANHGALEKNDHFFPGTNSRMDTLQAAVLLAKLPYLQEWNSKRAQNAALYNARLAGIEEITTPSVLPDSVHTFHIYAVRAQRRDDLQAWLESKGIQTLVHYPQALHNTKAYQQLGHRPDDFPVANRLQQEVLSLPIYPELTTGMIESVCAAVNDFYAAQKY